MKDTPKSLRLHIGLFGCRNAGKSSLLNALCRQQVAIVSEVAGTTTDPVEKPMELLPLGPVLFIDTAGIDDVGALGQLRAQGAAIEVKQAIQDLRDYWNRYIDNSQRPAALKFHGDPKENQVQ